MELLKLNIQKFASGTIDLGTSGNMKGRITWSSATNGAVANTSTITANIQVARTNSYTTTGTFTGNIYISDNSGGSNETFSKYTNVSDSWVTLYTRKFTAKHNNDGSGTAYIGGTIYGPTGTSLASNSVSDGKNVTLDKIARKATVSDATNMNDEQNPTISFSNPGKMSLVPYINLYLNGSVALRLERSKGSYSSPYTWNITDEEREQIRNVCKNVNSTTYTIGFDSYSGSTSLGYDSVQRTLTIVNANPVFNDFSFEDVNPITLALTGNNQNIIRNYSNVKSTIPVVNKAEALKSATMSKYRLNCNGNSTDITYSSDSDVQGTLNSVTRGVFDIYAIDSRNNSTLVTKNANSVIDYTPIVKGNISVARANGVSESVTLKIDGKADLVNFGVVTNSIKESKYRYKATDTTEWSDYTDLTLTVDTDGNFTFNDLISGDTEELGFNINNSYQVEVLIADKLSQVVYTATFGSGIPNIALSKNGVGIMGKYDEEVGGKGQVAGNPLAYYPIGSIYISANEENPETLFGGTWEQLKDRFLLACGDTYSNGATGGEATHTLTVDEMPRHNHAEQGYFRVEVGVAGGQEVRSRTKINADPVDNVMATIGASQPHNNMPPYLAVYMWKRIA